MTKNLKIYKFETKEDYILYLRELIILAHKHMKNYKRYLENLEKYIKKNEYDKKPEALIKPEVYFENQDKINNTSTYLFNLFADDTAIAMSYKKFRRYANSKKTKELQLGLDELSDEIQDIIMQFNNLRNWSSHVPESLITAHLEIIKKHDLENRFMSNYSTIGIPEFSAYEAAWLVDLLRENKNVYSGCSKIFQQMKRDYSKLTGSSMRIELKVFPIRPIKDMDVPKISFEIQKNSYEGIKNDIWLPK